MSFLLFECVIAVAVLLALAELVSWWAVALLSAVVTAMVKINDLVSGAGAGADRVSVEVVGELPSVPPAVPQVRSSRIYVSESRAAVVEPEQPVEVERRSRSTRTSRTSTSRTRVTRERRARRRKPVWWNTRSGARRSRWRRRGGTLATTIAGQLTSSVKQATPGTGPGRRVSAVSPDLYLNLHAKTPPGRWPGGVATDAGLRLAIRRRATTVAWRWPTCGWPPGSCG
jgi:hypothetical protein